MGRVTTGSVLIGMLASSANVFAQCSEFQCTYVPPNIQRELDQRFGTAEIAVFGSGSSCKPGGPTGSFCVQATAYVAINQATNQAAFICEAHGIGIAANVGIQCGPEGTTPAVGGGEAFARANGIVASDKENLVVRFSGISAGVSVNDGVLTLRWRDNP